MIFYLNKKNIMKAMKRKGFKRSEIADRIGISGNTLTGLLNNDFYINKHQTPIIYIEMAKLLNISHKRMFTIEMEDTDPIILS